jgi:oligopeptide transport system substrate-binding protein
MKWFYITSLAVTVALAMSPFLLLEKQAANPYGDRVVLWDSFGSAVKSIDPATCGDTTSHGIQANVYEGLYCYHFLKRPPEVVPQLAAEMPQISEDGLTYTIRLKNDARFHRNPCFGVEPPAESGGPGQAQGRRYKTRGVQAKDFVLAFKRCADYHVNTGLAWAFLSNRIVGLDQWRKKTQDTRVGDFARYDLPVAGLEAVDDLALRVRLTKRFPQFIYMLAISSLAPVPREAVDYWLGTEDDGAGGRRPVPLDKCSVEFREACQVVGTGPYVLQTFDRKSRIVLVRNEEFRPDFYPAEGTDQDRRSGLLADAGRRVPFIDVLHYDFVPEDYSGWMRFLSKQTDASGIPRDAFEFVITPDRDLAEAWRQRGIYLTRYGAPSVFWIAFNLEDRVLGKSRSLRQAMCLAFDVESYTKVLYNGRGRRAVNVIPDSFKGWKQAGPGPYYRLDLPAAQAKLAEARKELAAAGLLEDGQIPELKLDIGSRDTPAMRQGEFIQQQFQKLGLRINVIYNDWPTLQQKMHNKVTTMYTSSWRADYPDAENFLQLFYSPNIKKGTNNTNYSNPEFDRLFEQARALGDTPERTELYARMARMISDDCPVLLIGQPETFLLCYDWVKNVKPHPIGIGYAKYRRIDVAMRRKMGGR